MNASAPPAAAQYLQFARRLAAAAAAVTLPLFRQPLTVAVKSDTSPVTVADRDAEKAMRALISEQYPTHGIIGEEFNRHRADAEFIWVLDPIDGTRSFISGSPLYSTLVALLHQRQPLVGVLDFPALAEQYSGINTPQFQQATMKDTVCHAATAAPPLAEAVAATTTAAIADNQDDQRLQQFIRRCAHTRLGGDAFSYAGVAGGFCHLALDHSMKPHDYLPLIPVVTAAGGIISDWQGKPLSAADNAYSSSSTVLASANNTLHNEALALLAAL